MTTRTAPLNVLDLFAGLGGWSKPWREAGHRVTTLDFDPRFGCDYVVDILAVSDLAELERDGGRFDVVLASPPCEKFSVMTISRNWETRASGEIVAKTDAATHALRIAEHTFALIAAYAPRYYVVENPRGMLRRLAPRRPTATTWYCQWGMPYAKPTDLWTNIAGEWPTCRNGAPDHDYQPRSYGAKLAAGALDFGVQGRPNRAEIRERLERGERVPGWGLRPDGALRKRTTIGMTTRGTKRSTARRTMAFADRFRALTGDKGGGPKDREGAAIRALIPLALAQAVMRACLDGGRLPARDDGQERLAI